MLLAVDVDLIGFERYLKWIHAQVEREMACLGSWFCETVEIQLKKVSVEIVELRF